MLLITAIRVSFCYNARMAPQECIYKISTLKPLYVQEGISFVGLFGSQARGKAKKTSDVDVLIDYVAPKSLFELARIKIELEKALGKKVDLVTRKNLKPALRSNIELDLIPVYEKELA